MHKILEKLNSIGCSFCESVLYSKIFHLSFMLFPFIIYIIYMDIFLIYKPHVTYKEDNIGANFQIF